MRKCTCMFVLGLLIAGSVFADNTWTGAGTDDLWTNAANWSAGHAPVDSDLNLFFGAGSDAGNDLIMIDGTMDIAVNCDLYGPEWGLHLDIDGGRLTQVYLNDEGFVFCPVADSGAPSTVDVRNGGTLEVQELLLGDNWWFAGHPYVTLNVYDSSSVIANGWCWLGGQINLYGGTVDITGGMNFATGNGFAHINLEHGTLIIRDDTITAATVQPWEDDGFLTAFGGSDDVIIDDSTGDVIISAAGRLSAYNPEPTPVNLSGSIGTLISSTEVELALNWNAGIDPNTARGLPFNPTIVKHYVYVGAEGEPLAVAGEVEQTSPTDPANSLSLVLTQGTVYNWSVEEGIDDGTGNAYPAGDPNNIAGPAWSFRTKATTPEIITQPTNAVADPDATFTAAADYVTGYQWYKEAGETDIALADGGPYSGTQTGSLTVTNASLAEEGQYYCVAFNGAAQSDPSNAAWLWTQRLMGHWKFEGSLADSVADTVPGAPAHDGTIGANTVAGGGDPNFAAAGIDGGGIEFFDDGDYVALDNADFFNFYPLGFTVSGWYRTTGDVGWRLPISKLDAGSAGWLLGADVAAADQATCIIEVPNVRLDGDEGTDVGDGQWHLLTAAYDPADHKLRLFTDGDEDAQAVIDLGAAPLAAAPLSIGGRDGENSVLAEMDEVKIYSYALSPLEVATSYLDYNPDKWICVEDPANPLSFDLNNDCRVNLQDLSSLASQWLECQRIPTESCTY